jgi:phage/plasmid primase-like uncharacterized protein
VTVKRAQMNVRLDPQLIAAADDDRSTIGEKGVSRDTYVAQALTFYRTHRATPPEPDPAAALAEAAQLAARISGTG